MQNVSISGLQLSYDHCILKIDENNLVYLSAMYSTTHYLHCESKKLGHFFTAYNFRNIEQIFTKFGTNQSLFILNIVPEFI